jgi:hypothetical protein
MYYFKLIFRRAFTVETKHDENRLTSDDIKDIYENIEKSKKGAFYIDSSKKSGIECAPNHIEEPIAKFFESMIEGKVDKQTLSEDGAFARSLVAGLLNG